MPTPRKARRLASAALALSACRFACGFVSTGTASRLSQSRVRLNGMLPRREGGGEGSDEGADVEAARRRLEALIGGGSGPEGGGYGGGGGGGRAEGAPAAKWISPSLPPEWEAQLDGPPPPLTAIARERRLAEISLLRSLDDGDDALSDLWALWFSERGPDAAADLLRAERLTGRGPEHFDEAEDLLRSVIDEQGVHWAEPVNRLATLLYRRGRLEESRALCHLALAVKPWHFGALSGVVLVCAALGDRAGARLWAARRLPPVQPTGDNARRAEWVSRATAEATRSLERAEELVRESFGELDDYYSKDVLDQPVQRAEPFDDDAWQ